MASTLNMSYHGVQSLRSELGDQLTGSRALNHNRVAKLLHARGYSFVAFAHGYEMAEARMADVFLDVRPRRRLDGRFFQTAIDLTALRVLAVRWKLGQKRIEGLHRERVLFALERTPKLASSQGPVFAYVHILCPHGPIVFDAQGNTPPLFVDRRGWSPETPEARHGYVEQTKYLNGRLLQMVDEILAAATRPVVIVLQGDHGPRLLLKPGEGCDPNRLKILNAYLFPDRQYQKLSDSISPVNTFRVILSQYLGYDIPLLPDRREDPAGQECPTGLTDETERER
jgi:hypothetical protein